MQRLAWRASVVVGLTAAVVAAAHYAPRVREAFAAAPANSAVDVGDKALMAAASDPRDFCPAAAIETVLPDWARRRRELDDAAFEEELRFALGCARYEAFDEMQAALTPVREADAPALLRAAHVRAAARLGALLLVRGYEVRQERLTAFALRPGGVARLRLEYVLHRRAAYQAKHAAVVADVTPLGTLAVDARVLGSLFGDKHALGVAPSARWPAPPPMAAAGL